jgi:TonB-dependent Receptor Plug Domain
MRLTCIICSVSLIAIFPPSPSLQCQQLHSAKDSGRLTASEVSSRERNHSASSPSAIPASPLDHPPRADSSDKNADQRQSMFDALETGLAGPITTVEVQAVAREMEISEPFRAGGQEILSAAGVFGDVSRFLQLFPGVVATSDLSNEVMVRGGHPMENLFLLDGIEVPNINHLAMSGTSGGFGPMIDSALIQGVNFYTGGYDARYAERLSSVVEIQTLRPKDVSSHIEGDVGIQGAGGLVEKQFHGNDLLGSVHYGLLNLMDNAGISGLPSYINELIRFRRTSPSGNRLTILHIGGRDSVEFSLCPEDRFSFSSIDSQYSGWRQTTGMEWQRIYSTRSFGVATISDSEEVENIHQQDQLPDPQHPPKYDGPCPSPKPSTPPVPVYLQDSNDAFSNAGYRFEWSGSRFAVTAGSAFWLRRPHYQIEQPIGALSPYSTAPIRSDSTTFASSFSTGESGTFAQITAHPFSKFVLSAGGRLQTFALKNHTTLTPRVSLRFNPNEHVGVHVAFAGYEQLPPYVYLLSFPSNRSLVPMRATHEIVGLDLSPGFGSQLQIEAYNKIYSNIPASTEYPAINVHNLVDTIGQQFVWLPMKSGGRGQSSGIEVSDLTRIGSRTVMRGSVAYSRAMFTGLDGVRRPSNYDLPWIVNFAVLQRFGRGYEVSSRYGYATGRPYTPFDVPDSFAQNRPIYDVSQMNARRAPYFARLDAQLNKDFNVRDLHLVLYLGVNNILNRSNFLSYVWLPDTEIAGWDINPIAELRQMPIFPNFGLRYVFR